jgi:hypothetical protein
MTVFKERVRELRPAYLPPDPTGRTVYEAGEIAQCDFWFPPTTVPVGYGQARTATQLPVLTMVSGYSRWLSAILIPSRRAEDLSAGWWKVISALGAVPRTLVWDGEGAIGRWRSGRVELTGDCQAFRGVLGAKVVVLKPAEQMVLDNSDRISAQIAVLDARIEEAIGPFCRQDWSSWLIATWWRLNLSRGEAIRGRDWRMPLVDHGGGYDVVGEHFTPAVQV